MDDTRIEDENCTELLVLTPLFAQEAYIKVYCPHCNFTRFLYDGPNSADVADAQYAHDYS